MKNHLCLLLLLFFCHSISAQIPSNFEFLYHEDQASRIGATHLTDDGVLFVAHNSFSSGTSVNLARFDNSIEVIFETYLESRSKIEIDSEGIVHVLLYSLFDYDINVSGYFDISYNKGVFNVNFYDDYENQSGIAFQMTMDTLENYVYQAKGNNFITSNGDSIVNEVMYSGYISGMFQSIEGEILFFEKNKIKLLQTDQIIPVLETPETILDVDVKSDLIAVLHEGRIDLYDVDFILVNSFDVDSEIEDLKITSIIDSTLFTIGLESGDVVLNRHEWDGTRTEVYRSKAGNEVYTGIQGFSTESFMLEGYVEVPEVQWYFQHFRHAFLRHVDLKNTLPSEKTDISITDFIVDQISSDSVTTTVNSNGDSTFFNRYVFDITFNIQNQTEDSLYDLHLYKSPFSASFIRDNFQIFNLDKPLAGFENLEYKKTFEEVMVLDSLKSIKIVLLGGNHKFNVIDNIVTLPDFKSDVTNLELNTTLEIFPNPTHNFLNISSEKSISLVVIYNIQGQLVLTQYKKDGVRKIDVSNLDSGQYYLKTDNYVSKFIKQ